VILRLITPQRIFSLDFLRALAIILVLVCHLISRVYEKENFLAYYFGTLGVEIFFVLSGFLIGSIIIKIFNEEKTFKPRQIKKFWIRRWFRTLPNYYLVLLISIAIYSIYRGEFLLNNLSNFTYFLFIQNLITPSLSFFSVSWSLAVEEWFYLLFPITLFIFSKFIRDKYKTLLFSTGFFILFVIISKIIVAISFNNLDFSNFQYLMPLRLDSIAIGIFIAIINYYKSNILNENRIKFFIFGATLFFGSSLYYFLFILTNNYGFFAKVFFFDILSISIAFLFPLISTFKKFKNKFLANSIIYLSLISYSVYLIHLIIILVIIQLPLNAFFKITTATLLILIVSYIQYHFFEKPMTSLREKFSRSLKNNIKIN